MNAIKLWFLRWLMTVTSELGMACSRWTDHIQAALDSLAEAHD